MIWKRFPYFILSIQISAPSVRFGSSESVQQRHGCQQRVGRGGTEGNGDHGKRIQRYPCFWLWLVVKIHSWFCFYRLIRLLQFIVWHNSYIINLIFKFIFHWIQTIKISFVVLSAQALDVILLVQLFYVKNQEQLLACKILEKIQSNVAMQNICTNRCLKFKVRIHDKFRRDIRSHAFSIWDTTRCLEEYAFSVFILFHLHGIT